MRVLRLIENMTLGRNAVGYLTESMHGAGSPQAQRIQIARAMQIEFKKSLAKTLAGIAPESIEEPGEDPARVHGARVQAGRRPETEMHLWERRQPRFNTWQHLNPSPRPSRSPSATRALARWTITSPRPLRRSSPRAARNCARRSRPGGLRASTRAARVMRRFADAWSAHRDAIVAALAADTGRMVDRRRGARRRRPQHAPLVRAGARNRPDRGVPVEDDADAAGRPSARAVSAGRRHQSLEFPAGALAHRRRAGAHRRLRGDHQAERGDAALRRAAAQAIRSVPELATGVRRPRRRQGHRRAARREGGR